MELDIKTVPVIIYIPEETYRLTINAKMITKEDEFYGAEMVMGLPEITDARIEGEEWAWENEKWFLTEDTEKTVDKFT